MKPELATEFLANRHVLLSFISGLVRDVHEAEDIFQEVWIRLANASENGVVIESQIKWCRGVAKNLILHYWRDHRTAKVIADSELLAFLNYVELAYDEKEITPDQWNDRQQALHDCVTDLPEKSRHLLKLKYDEQCSIAEICRRMGKSSAAIVKALLRLRAALAICVEKKLRLLEFRP
jgi:RNA polymerase sigma-70 factor (ECF subfamily)